MTTGSLKRCFFALVGAMALAIAVAAWLASTAIGRIDAIEQASDDLELKSFRMAARMRAQVYRLSAVMLRYQVTGAETYKTRFGNYEKEIREFIRAHKDAIEGEPEAAILAKIEVEVTVYFEEANALIDGRDRRESAELSVERIERIKGQLDVIVELTNELSEARRAAFRSQLDEYRLSANALQRLILVAVTILILFVAAITWLAYLAFLRPLHSELTSARKVAVEKEQLATVGTLASGIAHEIRNPITAIKARVFALKELVEKESPAAKQADVIDGEMRRLERIVRDFLDFARPSEPNRNEVDLSGFLSGIEALVQEEMEERGIALTVDSPNDVSVLMDQEQMTQVLLNLIHNAADACGGREGGGRGSVEVAAEAADGQARISVRDNGNGMPAEVQERIFEPFFSRKPAGTGLGLPIARNIVERHGGELTFTSAGGKGTAFFIDLPKPN